MLYRLSSGGQRIGRVEFIQYKGKKILHLNFAECTSDEVLHVIEIFKAAIRTQSHSSVLTPTDVSNAAFNSKVSAAMHE